MGRRNDHSAEEFDQLVLTQVEEFLTRLPASELSLRKVAKMIGYAPSTLVHTYSNWSMLLLRVNARTLDRLLSSLIAIEDSGIEPEQRLYAIAESYLTFASKQPHLWGLLFEHKLPVGTDIPDWMQSRINRLFELVVQCLAGMNPGTSAQQQRLSANTLWASVHGITLLTLDDKLSLNMNSDPNVMLTDLLDNYLVFWKKA
ncbi:MAG: TetR-like C-terminal domain-containing protein [Aestuariibacter sp.]